MLDGLINVIAGFMTWLVSVLPLSPFTGMDFEGMEIGTYLGWLNWLMPFDDFLRVFAAWLIAGIAVSAVQGIIDFVSASKSSAIG